MTKKELISLIEQIVDKRIEYYLSIKEIRDQKSSLKEDQKKIAPSIKKPINIPRTKNNIIDTVLAETYQQVASTERNKELLNDASTTLTIEQQLTTLNENKGDLNYNINKVIESSADLSFLTKNYSNSSILKK